MSIKRTAAALLAVLAGATACGGAPPTRQEYAAQADRICREAEQALERIEDRPAATPQARGELIAATQRSLRQVVQRLSELERPEGGAGRLAQAYVAQLDQRADEVAPLLERLRAALADDDVEAIRRAARALETFEGAERADELARRLGARTCAG
ncbi:MAG TPA: hypothetical protein VGV36_06980 [Solirubrobacteraceae bacterium]|nr:hypothetical protein [Solirubrobacteraceae bacterium]